MTFKDLVYEYGREGSTEVMEKLTMKVNWFTEKVRESHPELVDKFLMKVDLLLNPHFTRETAEYAVSNLKNKDGTIGAHWNYETSEKVLYSNKLDFDEADWFYVLNMIYSDYYKSGRSDDTYIDLAIDFLSDEDAPKGKAKKYYWAMCD